MIHKGYILMFEEEPIAFFYNKADAEEMWFTLWEEQLYDEFIRTVNLLNVSIEYYLRNKASYYRLANYGFWIGEVPFLE